MLYIKDSYNYVYESSAYEAALKNSGFSGDITYQPDEILLKEVLIEKKKYHLVLSSVWYECGNKCRQKVYPSNKSSRVIGRFICQASTYSQQVNKFKMDSFVAMLFTPIAKQEDEYNIFTNYMRFSGY